MIKISKTALLNTTLVGMSCLVSIVLVNLFAAIFLNKYAGSKDWIIDEAQIDFYEYYEDKLNHLREPSWSNRVSHAYLDENDLLFNHFPSVSGAPSFLIAGDSWAEKFSSDVRSYATLEQFSNSEGIELVLAGTTSFSPTLIGTQIYLLDRQFGLTFDKIFVVLDNTDIGDELCRYRSHIYSTVPDVDYVRSFDPSDNMAAYTHRTAINVSKVINATDYSIVKVLKLALIKLGQSTITFDKASTCGWSQISRYLNVSLSAEEKSYIFSRFRYLLNIIYRVNKNTDVILITSPHRGHILERYNISISELLDEFLASEEYETVEHYDVSKEIIKLLENGTTRINDIFIEGDPASHFTSLAHNEIFIPIIIEKSSSE